jgi:uncharacterized small protein (DUF1192 family)
MQLTPYAELIQLSPEERAKKTVLARINKEKQRGLLKVAEFEERITSLEDTITTLCSNDSLNFELIADKQDELALAIRRRDQLVEIVNQLFPNENNKA